MAQDRFCFVGYAPGERLAVAEYRLFMDRTGMRYCLVATEVLDCGLIKPSEVVKPASHCLDEPDWIGTFYLEAARAFRRDLSLTRAGKTALEAAIKSYLVSDPDELLRRALNSDASEGVHRFAHFWGAGGIVYILN